MNPWALLAGLLGYNYRRHLLGRHTLCSTGRRFLPQWAFLLGWGLLTAWIVPHVIRGYDRT